MSSDATNNSVALFQDVYFLGILGILSLFAVPRYAARFSNTSEWRYGLSIYKRRQLPVDSVVPSRRSSNSETTAIGDHVAEPSSVNNALFQENTRRREVARLPAYSTFAPILASVLRSPWSDHLSISNICLILLYVGGTIFACLWKTDPFSHTIRLGFVAVAQLPFVYALAMKNNVIGWMLGGLGYEKLNWAHRVFARGLVIIANFHALGWIYLWSISDPPGQVNRNLRVPFISWGLTTLVFLDIVMILGSLTWVRQRYYRLFYISHVVGLVTVLVALSYHIRDSIPKRYVWATIGIYAGDRLLRFLKMHVVTAKLYALPQLRTTRVEFPTLNSGWRPGQHVRIRVLSRGMGLLGWRDLHPFTIASAPDTNGLVLMVKRAGGWTDRLYQLASPRANSNEAGANAPQTALVWIEGPYGGSGNTMYNAFSGIIIFAGGSGVSFPLSVIPDVLHHAAQGHSNVNAVALVWTVQDPSAVSSLLPLFTDFLSKASTVGVQLTIAVHFSRVPKKDQPAPEDMQLPQGVSVIANRPDLKQEVEALIARTKGTSGVLVASCGPTALSADARATVAKIDGTLRKEVGGVEFHAEVFGWGIS